MSARKGAAPLPRRQATGELEQRRKWSRRRRTMRMEDDETRQTGFFLASLPKLCPFACSLARSFT